MNGPGRSVVPAPTRRLEAAISPHLVPLLAAALWAAPAAAPPTDGAEGGVAAPADPPPPVAPPATPDLRGTWRMDLSLTTKAKIPVLGDMVIQTGSVYLVQVKGTAERPVQHQTVCSISPNNERSIATTTIPDGFIEAMPDKVFPLSVVPDGDQWTVSGDMKPLAIGFDEKKVSGELVPQEADHPAVGDHEGDGHPGATVHLKAPLFGQVEVYMLQHARTLVRGTWDGADGTVDGRATVKDFAQRTIGASNRLFIANPKLSAVPETSTYRMARVPQGTTCAQLRAGLAAP